MFGAHNRPMPLTTGQIKELQSARDDALIENTAQSIFKYLEELENRRSLVKNRWIWELLQNARDSSATSPVRVSVRFLRDKLVFKHNGDFFTSKEVSHLIFHGSSKQEQNDGSPLGHFGSGFISTHLISRTVQVEGFLHNGCSFNFTLDRQGINPLELRSLMDRSWNAFLDSLETSGAVVGDFSTQFTYSLSPQSSDLVESGIRALEICAPFVLVFNPRIATIEIEHETDRLIFSKEQSSALEECIITKIHASGNSGERTLLVGSKTCDGLTLAVGAQELDGSLCVNLADKVPRLFLAFPLHDTEDFCLPLVINSESFTPNEDRGGVFLGTSNTESVKKNEELFSAACAMIPQLVIALSNRQWANTASLASLNGSYEKAWVDKVWYRNLLKEKLVDQLRESPFLLNLGGKLIPPQESWIPSGIEDSDLESLWSLAAALRDGADHLPNLCDLKTWSANLKDWESVCGAEFPEALSLEDLANRVSNCGTVSGLELLLTAGTNSLDWLNSLYALLLKYGLSQLFDDLQILPDQELVFHARNLLARDDGIDEVLKDIAENLQLNIRSRLLNKQVSPDVAELLHQSSNEEHVLQELLIEIQKWSGDRDVFERGSLLLFEWLADRKRFDSMELFPFLTTSADVVNLKSASDSRILLAPVGAWPATAQSFAGMFPRSRVIDTRYYQTDVGRAVWQNLGAKGLVHLSPTMKTSTLVEDFLVDFSDDLQHKSTTPVEQTQLLFLSEKDVGLIDVARKRLSKSREFLRFVLEYVVPADQDALLEKEVPCECGESHRYLAGNWLMELRKRSWVFVSANRSARASAASLSGIVRDHQELSEQMSQDRGIALLQALGVSPSDFSLRLLAKDEAERVGYIRSVADLQNAVGNDITKLLAFTSAVRDDPQIIDLVEIRRKTRDRVNQNQQIGSEIERLLAESLRIHGLRVTRTGIGSDFEVETDFSEDGGEVILTIEGGPQTHLIEIKCTRTDDVRMTPKQAEVASGSQNRFSLCVVELASQDPMQVDIPATAKFVNDIGTRVEPLWNNYQTIEHSKNQTQMQLGDITLEIAKDFTRFRVSRAAWELGMAFREFVEFIRNKNRQGT